MYNRDSVYKELSSISSNKHYLHRYIKFINLFDNYTESGERHHILPASIFPDYAKIKLNIVKLPLRAHYLAHYMLAKAIGNKMWFAFNMMSRIKNRIKFNSKLYESTRLYLREASSKMNKGREMSDSGKKAASDRLINTLVVKDSNGNRFRVSKDDTRYINNELVSYRIGYTHSSETKEKMSINGILNKKAYTHKETGIVSYHDNTPLDNDYMLGNLTHKGESKEYLIDTVWVSKDGKSYRKNKEDVCDDEVTGRLFNCNGFSNINSKIKVFDLTDWKYKLVDDVQIYQFKHGSSTRKMKFYCYKNTLFTNYNLFETYCKSNYIYIPCRNFNIQTTPKKHFNMKHCSNLDDVSTLQELGYHTICYDDFISGKFILYNYTIYKQGDNNE